MVTVVPRPSVLSTQILAAASLGFCLSFFFGQVLTALGRPGLRLGVVVAQAISLCAVCLIGVRFGLAGVSLAVMLNQVLFYGVELVILRRNAGFSLPAYLGEGMLPLAGSVAMAAGVILLGRAMGDFPPIARLAADVALGMAIYGAILLIFARHRLRELLEMARGLRR